jgi:hypothetical protein
MLLLGNSSSLIGVSNAVWILSFFKLETYTLYLEQPAINKIGQVKIKECNVVSLSERTAIGNAIAATDLDLEQLSKDLAWHVVCDIVSKAGWSRKGPINVAPDGGLALLSGWLLGEEESALFVGGTVDNGQIALHPEFPERDQGAHPRADLGQCGIGPCSEIQVCNPLGVYTTFTG